MKYTPVFIFLLAMFGCAKENLDLDSKTAIELSTDKTEVVLDNIKTSDTISIESNVAWKVNVDTSASWISVEPKQDSGSSQIVITSRILNNSGADRTTAIELESQDGSETVVINVTQKYVLVPLGFAFGGEGNDVFTSIERTIELDYIAVGYTESTQGDISQNKGGKDVWIARITPAGEKVWSKTYGGGGNDIAHRIYSRFDGTFMIFAETNSSNGDISLPLGGKDAWILAIDGNGELLWEKTVGTPADDAITSVLDGANPGFVFTGVSQGDQWLGRISDDATIIWDKRFGSTGEDVGVSVSESLDGLIFCGYGTVRDGDVADKPTANTPDVWVLRTDADGNILWKNYVGGENVETAVTASWLDNGTVMVFGHTNGADEFPDFSGVQQIFLSCYDKEGKELWKKLLKHSDWDEMSGLSRSRHADLLIYGKTLVNNLNDQPTFDAAIWRCSPVTGDVLQTDIFESAHEEEIHSITRGGTTEYPLVGSTTTYPDEHGNSTTNSAGWFYTWKYPTY